MLTTLGEGEGDGEANVDMDADGETDACVLAGWTGGAVRVGAWPGGCAVCCFTVALTRANAPPPAASSTMTVTRTHSVRRRSRRSWGAWYSGRAGTGGTGMGAAA